MASIAYDKAQQNTQQTRATATYADVSGASLASGNFVNGQKYLLFVTAQVSVAAGTSVNGVQVAHGGTAFAESELLFVGAGNRSCFQYFTVWTAVTGEAVTVQIKGDGANNCQIDQIAMFQMRLDADLTENTDWVYAERTNNDALSTTPTDGASITFTPGVASHDWLVLTHAQYDLSNNTTSAITALIRSGEASSSTPTCRTESNASAQTVMVLTRTFSLGNASNTFKEQSASTGTSHTRLNSKVFAIDLNKFAAHLAAYTDGDFTFTSTSGYGDQLQTGSITPTVTGDVLCGVSWGWDKAAAARSMSWRLQIDNADDPAGQTSDAYVFDVIGTDSTDEAPEILITIPSLTNAAHTLDLDGHVSSTTSSPSAQQRSLWAFTMELPAVATSTRHFLPLLGVG